MNKKFTSLEFDLIHKCIIDLYGISIPANKVYLIEDRLAKILDKYCLKNFMELYYKLNKPATNKRLIEEIADAVTIKETHWFRDKTPWQILENELLPTYVRELAEKKRSKVRIWIAACSSGQEAYSVAMSIDNYLSKNKTNVKLKDFEIYATDLSAPIIDVAKAGKYDQLALSRGLEPAYLKKYFTQSGETWTIKEFLKDIITFQQFNLKDSFYLLGKFDIIFCRYVIIYFSEIFKEDLFRRISNQLNPDGVLFLGNSEIFLEHKDYFTQENYQKATYYRKRKICVKGE